MDKKIRYKPAPGYLLVEPQESQQGKVFIQGDEFPQVGKVLAVGDPTYYPNTELLHKSPCKVGDRIIHSAGGFENVVFDGKKYRLVKFSLVLMIK